jgi:hypothetical protein
MVTASNPSFDAYCVNASAALKMLAQGQQWREQIMELQQHRLERDRAALEGALETLRDAHDWSDLATASQSVLRDYLNASAAIWQDGVTAAMHGAGAWSDVARDMTQHWHDSLCGLEPATVTASAMPMREWMAAFERAVSGTAGGAAHDTTASASHATAAAHAHGEQHGR